MITRHAEERINKRYKDNERRHLLRDLRKAKEIKNFLVKQDLDHKDRVRVYFSADKHFLWSVILSKKDGAVITVLPIGGHDLRFALENKILDQNKRHKKIY